MICGELTQHGTRCNKYPKKGMLKCNIHMLCGEETVKGIRCTKFPIRNTSKCYFHLHTLQKTIKKMIMMSNVVLGKEYTTRNMYKAYYAAYKIFNAKIPITYTSMYTYLIAELR